ncbi:glycoside hydrolase family 172 protein [Breznakiella homolactica]|uniref:DUF2961 domain-containing protein n=1 Tax=Breznakiella homolactica TaxID=2798577 RepID=A0A7T7XLC0_9SPIR|nr:glycoside hydrolase family 172 protein [Breznakiella homolactica]QQO08396.1 DUF2961 domain-containing protein [Breznakiella homolactica]
MLYSGLNGLPFVKNEESRSVSPENPGGSKGGGGKAAGKLGPGRKGRAYIDIDQGETAVLADIEGPGVINHIWITVQDKTDKGVFVLRDFVLRMYWDDEQTPSVEVPLGDFFCNGFSTKCNVYSMPILVAPYGGFNSFFSMPFRRRARITIENQHPGPMHAFFYTVNYSLVPELPPETAYFHAQWRRERVTEIGRDYVIADGIRGTGHYVGTYLAWTALERYWWGEGEIKCYIDGDTDFPTICGTGVEDYVGGAWGFYELDESGYFRTEESTYCSPFMGYPFYSKIDNTRPKAYGYDALPMHGLYRWHILDPIRFKEDFLITVQQIGHDGDTLFERSDDIASTAYWYQMEPHGAFPALPPAEQRRPR